MTDNNDQPPFSPPNPLERVFSKLHAAMVGYSGSLKVLNKKIEEQGKKLDTVLQLMQSSNADSRVAAEQLDRILEFEREEHADLRELRNSLAEQHQRLITAGHEIVEARRDIDDFSEVRALPVAPALPVPNELTQNIGHAIGAAKWFWIGMQKLWPILLPAGGAGFYHAIRTWLSP
jgi:hypothetical protein